MSDAGRPTGQEKKQRGQFFTRHDGVRHIMANLVAATSGRACEPSAGAGHLVAALEQFRPGLTIDAVEVDDRLEPVCATPVTCGDFFTWAHRRDGTYQVVFGNPPYVAWKDVCDDTRASAGTVKAAYGDKTNLYHLFIDRCADLCADGGEMVLIVPKEWLYTTSAAPLRRKLADAGAITHLVDCGEEKLFADAAVPALLIFRWVRGATQGTVRIADGTADAAAGRWRDATLVASGHRWMFLNADTAAALSGWGRLGTQYRVRVGLVTGADRVFRLTDPDSVEPDCVQYQVDTSRQLVPFLNVNHVQSSADMPARAAALLAPHEQALRTRRIAAFDDTNWWRYGAIRNDEHMRSDTQRFFALAKTRSAHPFFTVDGAHFYTGAVLGIFRCEQATVDVADAVALLNSPRYRTVLEAMGLTSADKVSLQPATLEDAPFPPDAAAAAAFLADSSPA